MSIVSLCRFFQRRTVSDTQWDRSFARLSGWFPTADHIITQYLNYHQCSVLIVICALLHQVQQGGWGVYWGCPRHDEVRLVFEIFSILYLFAFLTCVQHSADLGLMTWRCFQLKRPLQILILTQASASLRTLHFSGFTFLWHARPVAYHTMSYFDLSENV